MVIINFTISSCNKQEEKPFSNQTSVVDVSALPPGVDWVIHHGSWSKWGRLNTAMQCTKWGLCNYSDCWFCCINEHGTQVDCDTGYPTSQAGVVYIDPETSEGFLLIELNPSETEENNAIQDQAQFFVDEDLESTEIIIKSGVYDFDASIGDHGGYMINAEQK